MHQLLNEYLTELPASLNNFFTGVANTTSNSIGVEGVGGGSHKVAGRGYVNTENSQMASIGAISTPYITKSS